MGDLIGFLVWLGFSWGIFTWERNGALHCMVWLAALGFLLRNWVLGLGLGIWHHGKLASMASGHGQDHHSGSLWLSGIFTGVGMGIRYHGSLCQGLYYVGAVMEEPPAALAGHNKLIVLIIFSPDPWSTCSIVCASYSFSLFFFFFWCFNRSNPPVLLDSSTRSFTDHR